MRRGTLGVRSIGRLSAVRLVPDDGIGSIGIRQPYSRRHVQVLGRAEVAQSGTARVWKARGEQRLGSSNVGAGGTGPKGNLPLGAALFRRIQDAG